MANLEKNCLRSMDRDKCVPLARASGACLWRVTSDCFHVHENKLRHDHEDIKHSQFFSNYVNLLFLRKVVIMEMSPMMVSAVHSPFLTTKQLPLWLLLGLTKASHLLPSQIEIKIRQVMKTLMSSLS